MKSHIECSKMILNINSFIYLKQLHIVVLYERSNTMNFSAVFFLTSVMLYIAISIHLFLACYLGEIHIHVLGDLLTIWQIVLIHTWLLPTSMPCGKAVKKKFFFSSLSARICLLWMFVGYLIRTSDVAVGRKMMCGRDFLFSFSDKSTFHL